MLVDKVSETSFEGKIIYGKKLTKPMIDYANKILDVNINGTARERIKKAPYDLYIDKFGTKKSVHPKIYFGTYFNRLKHDDYRHYKYSEKIRLDSGSTNGAVKLHKFLNEFESIKDMYSDAYNTLWEKICVFFKF